jgi:hypothetical protein
MGEGDIFIDNLGMGIGQDERLVRGRPVSGFLIRQDLGSFHDTYWATELRGIIFQNKYQTTPLRRTTATIARVVLAFGAKADSMNTPGKRSKTPRSIGAIFM